MNFSSTTTHQSKTVDGVSFVIRRIGPVTRAQLELKTSQARAELRELYESLAETTKEFQALIRAAGVDDKGEPLVSQDKSLITPAMVAANKQRVSCEEAVVLYQTVNVKPEWVRSALVSVAGITVDDAQITTAQFPDIAPAELFNEVYDAISTAAYLTVEQAKNLQSSTTSSGVAEDQTTSTNAAPVNS